MEKTAAYPPSYADRALAEAIVQRVDQGKPARVDLLVAFRFEEAVEIALQILATRSVPSKSVTTSVQPTATRSQPSDADVTHPRC